MKKQLISSLLTLCMLLTMLPAALERFSAPLFFLLLAWVLLNACRLAWRGR